MMRRLGICGVTLGLFVGMLSAGLITAPAQAAYQYSAPKDFKVTKTGNTFVQLSWSAPSRSIERYAIQYSTSSSMSNAKYRIATNATVSQINDLKPQTTYYFKVRATKPTGANISDWSSRIFKKTASTAFPAPTTPTFSRDRKDSFKLNWGEVANASSYRIQLSTRSSFTGDGEPGGGGGAPVYLYSTDNSGYVGRGGTVTTNTPGIDLETLIKPSTTYYVRVKALEAKSDENGNVYDLTTYSGTRSKKTSASWTVYPADDFKVVSSSQNEIKLSWTDVSAQPGGQGDDATHYRIQGWKSTSDKRYLNTDTIPAGAGSIERRGDTVTLTMTKLCTSTPVKCSTFTAGSSYYFRVSAYKSAVNISDYTASSGVKAIATSQVLPTPADLKVDSVTDKTVTMSWKPVAGASSYRLQQKYNSTSGTTRYLYDICDKGVAPTVSCTESDGRVSVILNRFQDNGTGSSSNIAANQTYYIRVAAQRGDIPDGSGREERVSDYSASYAKATTKGWPFDPPSNLVATDKTDSSVTLKWDAAPTSKGDVKYRMQVAGNDDMSGTKTYPVSGLNATSMRVSGLSRDKTYYFRIRVVDPANNINYSDYTKSPSTGRTTDPRGTVTGTLAVAPGCDVDDYKLSAYWGDDLADEARPQSGNTFRIANLRQGGYKFQYSYAGSGNCLSPWVSSNTAADHESHMLQDQATTNQVTANTTKTLPSTAAVSARTINGVARNSAGTALSGVFASAIGAPANPSDYYREVHAIVMTDDDGAFRLEGLWPNKKYKFNFQPSATSMGQTYKGYNFWVNRLQDNAPPVNVQVRLCGSSESGCTSLPRSYSN